MAINLVKLTEYISTIYREGISPPVVSGLTGAFVYNTFVKKIDPEAGKIILSVTSGVAIANSALIAFKTYTARSRDNKLELSAKSLKKFGKQQQKAIDLLKENNNNLNCLLALLKGPGPINMASFDTLRLHISEKNVLSGLTNWIGKKPVFQRQPGAKSLYVDHLSFFFNQVFKTIEGQGPLIFIVLFCHLILNMHNKQDILPVAIPLAVLAGLFCLNGLTTDVNQQIIYHKQQLGQVKLNNQQVQVLEYNNQFIEDLYAENINIINEIEAILQKTNNLSGRQGFLTKSTVARNKLPIAELSLFSANQVAQEPTETQPLIRSNPDYGVGYSTNF